MELFERPRIKAPHMKWVGRRGNSEFKRVSPSNDSEERDDIEFWDNPVQKDQKGKKKPKE